MPAPLLHVEQQIINAVVALLTAGNTAAGSDVYADRVDPIPAASLPAIAVEEADRGTTVAEFTVHGLQQREFDVQVDAIVAVATGYAQAARALGLEVEKLMAESTTLEALAQGGVQLVASQFLKDGAGERPLAARRQIWRFTYFVNPATPDVVD